MALSDLKNILVIDDNETDLLIAQIVLQKAGFNGIITIKNSVNTGMEYLLSIENNTESWPEIIFLDINMPLVNGFGFLDSFENLSKSFVEKVKIAVLSSSDNKKDADKFSSKKYVIDFMSKPLSIESFKRLVVKYISIT